MTDREELRRLIDVIEKASASVQLDQAIEDIKTFANTTSFLANKLETRLKGGDVKGKKQPKSRVGKAIAAPPVPKPNVPSPQQAAPDAASGGMPSADQLQHHRRTTTGSSRRARRDQYLAAEHCGVTQRLCAGCRR